ncbi:hypothetical protein [Kinneretia aquatilis]|uniref:hypothetical protein n=1 Tax=Kinneretia aquatilis TaxID=2070761 RepID=UPI00149515D1|nr:hypothetical protein [Paucibacter aquatile]WIV99628.1 hypothetical protein K9V56_009205 [Paucibacter aquatile]
MTPVTDTLAVMFEKAPEAFAVWILFGLFPILVPAIWAVVIERGMPRRARFVVAAATRIVGQPALLIILVGVPFFVFELLLVPVILDAYPLSRTILRGPLAVSNWLARNWFWLLPLLWPVWVGYATYLVRREWHGARTDG